MPLCLSALTVKMQFVFLLLPLASLAQHTKARKRTRDSVQVSVVAIAGPHVFGGGATLTFEHARRGAEDIGMEMIVPVRDDRLLVGVAHVQKQVAGNLRYLVGAGMLMPRAGVFVEGGLALRWRHWQSSVTYRYLAFRSYDEYGDDGGRLSGLWVKVGLRLYKGKT